MYARLYLQAAFRLQESASIFQVEYYRL